MNFCTVMSKKTNSRTAAEFEQSPPPAGEGSHTLNLLRIMSPDNDVQRPSCDKSDIKQLLEEFTELYQQRLRSLDLDTNDVGQEQLQKKVNFLQTYVNDLTDQNQVLLQTVEDLQKEAGCTLSNVGKELRTSDHILEVSEVNLRTMMLDELVGPAAHIPHSSCSLVQVQSELEDLKVQLLNKHMIILDLEKEHRESLRHKQKALESSERLVHLQSELSCLQQIQKDHMKEIAGKDICITKLRANIELLQQEGSNTQAQLTKLRARARELQQELKRKEEEWGQTRDELKWKYEKELQEAEERKRQEQQKREEEKDEWKRVIEEERKAHAQAVQKCAERTAVLNTELKVSRKQAERQSRELSQLHQKEETLLSEAEAKMVSLRVDLSALLDREMEEKVAQINQLSEELNGARQQMTEREELVRNLDQDVVGLRATQDSLKRTLAMKEKHTKQLVRDNAQLKESLASLQSKLQTGECMMRETSESLDHTRTSLKTERQQKQKIQDQLQHANTEMERLQRELTCVRHTAEKKMQRREIKMCALVKELQENKRQHSECQKELLRREKASEKLCEERDELRAKMDDRSRECVHLNQTQERLEADLALSHEKLHTLHLEVRSRDQLILQLRAEMKSAEQKHQKTQEQVASLEAEIRNLKDKSRGQEEEASKLSEKVREIQRLKDQTEKDQQQLQHQLSTSQQQEAVKHAHKIDVERWSQRGVLLHSRLNQNNSEISQIQGKLSDREVKTFEEKLKKQEVEMKLLHQQLKGAKEAVTEASLQKETICIFKQKYTAAIEKVHRVRGQVQMLEEELRYSQQQLMESQLATHSVKDELAEMVQRHKEKVAQWENSREALDQLTDELQATQNLLKESQQTVDHLQCLKASLQEQVDNLKKQKQMLEADLQRYQQSHNHSDEEYVGLLRDRQLLQQSCTEQAGRHAECEKAILQMKSELERHTQEKESLKQRLLTSHHTHMKKRSHLDQEVKQLKKEVTHLKVELADNQKVHVTLLRQSEEELKEARQEAARVRSEVDAQRGEMHTLKEELQKKDEEMRRVIREKQSLSGRIRRLNQEKEELLSKHQVAVEELAARAEEARRMEGCLTEGKLAEEKIRSMAVKLELDVEELRRNLQQAVSQKLQAEREKQDAQDQVDALRSELEGTRCDNTNLRQESQLVMTHVNRWITEQKASNESLSAQMKAQKKVLLIMTEEKEHLQEANDTLNAEVKRLKEVANEKERDVERFKEQIRDQGVQREGNIVEKHSCVALNLCKIEDMQTRLRSNLEAIGMLNQQINALSQENRRLRRQLEEERTMRRKADYQGSSIHRPLSLSSRPLPPSTLPSSLRRPHPLSSATATGDIHTYSKLSGAELERPGESRALDEVLREKKRPTASLEDARSGRTSRDLIK